LLKRSFDIVAGALGLVLTAPILVPMMLLVWAQDRHSPFYVAARTGRQAKPFRMVKLRSMVVDADKSGVDSTGAADRRITPIGHFIRRLKLDELPQLWNVIKGDMSLVGPRPNVKRETDLYTSEERELLTVRPGVTDFASIVFADEGEILKDRDDPDLAYNQLIRPGKSRLGMFYVQHRSLWVDVQLCLLTGLAGFSRERALRGVTRLLENLGADSALIELASRRRPLAPMAPPGADSVVVSRATHPMPAGERAT
jgi:lipopolysaccharide/colanic/teichoic acid biosynthesis glycosyltransferase